MKHKKLRFRYGKETKIPRVILKDAPRSGPFDDYGASILADYDIDVPLEDSIKYLKNIGCWEPEELQDLEANKARLIWLSVMECLENKTNLFYMGI